MFVQGREVGTMLQGALNVVIQITCAKIVPNSYPRWRKKKWEDKKKKSPFSIKNKKRGDFARAVAHSIFSVINEYGEPCLSDVDIESDEDDASKGKRDINGMCLMVSNKNVTSCNAYDSDRNNEALRVRKENIWLVDSGCSRHMTGDKNWFSSLKRVSQAESVTSGDASTSTVVAKGLGN
ncbi:uncharacterized protein LOC112271721 [Brachypodium distachyon]|uniref:uncharacterized protein LOC112271721 n=1 Tax=Brachypodium distachyon TaxID=15368 RepID=UPI000D0CBEA7|nr:uncharacterized protein LOC112271721 [Brachypodium distachyon]|eukprot:XP_024317313.1 uncharacterized protein LOC112271721 [Brachypodium distachyon]